MSANSSLYPPAPPGIPDDLTTPSPQYRLLTIVVLISLILFVLFYIGLVIGAGYLVYFSFTYSLGGVNRGSVILKLGSIAISAMMFLFLLKGLFKWRRMDNSQNVPVREQDYPELYDFVRQLCRETGAPFPKRIYLSYEVNAAVFYDSSLLSLIWPVRKNLLIGLGLVNMLNLNEFKAVLAHEFGHFSQKSMKLGSYVYTANDIITDMVYGRDFWDDLLRHWRCIDLRLSFPAWALSGIVWVLRKILAAIFRLINLGNLALTRQMEFNADLVAVSVTGSDALIHALSKLDFANQALMQAVRDLQDASDHQLYSSDLFYHQAKAVEFLRIVRKDQKLGRAPELPQNANVRVQVFDQDDGPPPTMWSTHPSNLDREENAKAHYIRSIEDDRSPWLLFGSDRGRICSQVTKKVYKTWLPPETKFSFSPAKVVQKFIDEEHAEMMHDPKYHGLYDGRVLEPGNLNDLIKEPLFPNEELQRRYANLYAGELETMMKRYHERLKDLDTLTGLQFGVIPMKGSRFSFRDEEYHQTDLEHLMKKVDDELGEDRKWQSAMDRQVFSVHYQLGKLLGSGLDTDFVDRYTFHMSVQDFTQKLGKSRVAVENILQFLSTGQELSKADMDEVLFTFADAHRTLEEGLNSARQMFLPALSNMQAGQPLAEFLLEERLVSSVNTNHNSISGEWIEKFLKQLGLVLDRLGRIHAKSIGAILTLQEKIGTEWEKAQQAVAPEPAPAPTVTPAHKDLEI